MGKWVFLATCLVSFGAFSQDMIAESSQPEFSQDLELGSVDLVNQSTGEVLDTKILGVDLRSAGAFAGPSPFAEPAVDDATKALEEFDLKQLKEVVILGLDIVDTVYNWLEKKKPIVLVENKTLSFVPTREDGSYVTPFQMAGWSAPVSLSYELVFKNLYGMTMAKVQLSPSMVPGGSFQGRGAYLQGVQVPSLVTAHLGVKATVANELVSVTNAGTEEEPVIACVVNAKVTVGTIISQHDLTYPIYFSADGSMKFL